MKKFNQIYQAMVDKFLQVQKRITNFNVSSAIRSLFEAVAEGVEQAWFYIDGIFQSLFIETAKSAYLDKRAKEMGLERRDATKSTGTVTFTGSVGTIYPAGQVVSTDLESTNVVEFETLSQVTVPAGGTVDAEIQAKVAGSAANVEAGQINTCINSPGGHTSITNQQPTSGGANQETDESLRQRCILKWYATTYGPTNNTIRSWCLEVEGVAEAKVIGNFPLPGQAKVLVWSRNQAGALTPASTEIVDAVQALLDERRPVCFILTAEQPEGILIDVEVEIEVESGFSFLDVSEAVKSAVQDYFSSLGVGDDVLRAEILYAVMDTAHVENANVIEPAQDEEIGATDTAILGECIITEMQ